MTKKQKLHKKALRQRVCDLATGAAGFKFDEEGELATADFLSRFIPAIEVAFGINAENHSYVCKVHNLQHFNDIDSTTEYLWEEGIRA